MFLIIDHSPLEAYADHVYYMRLACGHNPRCVRLGDAIAPLRPLDRSTDENLACVRDGLAYLARAVPPNQQNQEPVSKIVYLLVAGRISPQTAINQLRSLVQPNPTVPAGQAARQRTDLAVIPPSTNQHTPPALDPIQGGRFHLHGGKHVPVTFTAG